MDTEHSSAQVQHVCHPAHPLKPLSSQPTSFLWCSSCGQRCLPEDIASHPEPEHLLESFFIVYGVLQPCLICEKPCLPGQVLCKCEERECSFYVHKSCLDFLPQLVQLKHGGGEVSNWVPQQQQDIKRCIGCGNYQGVGFVAFRRADSEQQESPEYLCFRCCLERRLLDEYSLDRIPGSIHHFFHLCPLTLLEFSPSTRTTCNACFLDHHLFSYHCEDCHFFLGFECAQLPEVDDESSNQILRHFCHHHPLQLIPEEEKAIDGETLCKLCETSTSSNSFYGCNQCKFYAHNSCIDILPRKAIHPLLKVTIVLLSNPSYECATCKRACSGLTYYCIESKCNICVKCIVRPKNKFGDSGGFKSIHHWHQLTLEETGEVDGACCFMCGEACSGWNYKCKVCDAYFHKSCAESPRELQHPIHPHHPLTLTDEVSAPATKEVVVNCKLCHKVLPRHFPLYNKFYRCESCCFALDTRCASFLSSIEYHGHPHLLGVVDSLSLDDQASCNLCHKTLSRDFPVLRCTESECNFSLHLLCGPLPCKIKDPLHVHPLTLQEYYVEDNVSDAFACHICEEKRDPRLRVYLCTEGCFMTCDVKCVLTEVVSSLRGERGEMELDTGYPKIACKLITIRDSVLKGIACATGGGDDENVVVPLPHVPVFSLVELIGSTKPESDSMFEPFRYSDDLFVDVSDLDGSKYSYSRKAFERFTKNFELMGFDWDDFKDIFSKHDRSSIGGDYLLPNTLIPAYQNFLQKHTIFGPGCNLDHSQKRLVVFTLCAVIHDMRTTKVVDVSPYRIALWRYTFKFLQEKYKAKGLELDFLFQHVARIADDHYMVRAVDIIETTFSELCKEKDELYAREERLIRELAETRSEIEDNKERLKRFRAYRAAGASELKKEYYASLENKWRPCCEFSGRLN